MNPFQTKLHDFHKKNVAMDQVQVLVVDQTQILILDQVQVRGPGRGPAPGLDAGEVGTQQSGKCKRVGRAWAWGNEWAGQDGR